MKQKYDGTIIPSGMHSIVFEQNNSNRYSKDFNFYIGTIINKNIPEENKDGLKVISYNVRVLQNGSQPIIFKNCVPLTSMASLLNYQLHTLETSKDNKKFPTKYLDYDNNSLTGCDVVISFIEGNQNFPIIVGCFPVENNITKEEGMWYIFNFNGKEFKINNKGELSFVSSDLNTLENGETRTQKSKIIKEKERDFKPLKINISKDHEFTVLDGLEQKFHISQVEKLIKFDNKSESFIIDQQNKKISLTSGETFVIDVKKIFTINSDKITISSNIIEFNIKDTFTINSKTNVIKSSSKLTISSPKITIGNGSVELLSLINELIDSVGLLTIPTSCGPTAPVQSSPQWAKIKAIQQKLKSITG
jgi:phage gp45-like